MVNRRINRISRRSVLGAGLFVGSSLLIKACGQPQATAPEGEESAAPEAADSGGAVGGSVIAVAYPGAW
ncbi:MAG: hypothetical protein AAGF98_18550, partial [Cyanobacteria bacterium P01_H01_bin.153]